MLGPEAIVTERDIDTADYSEVERDRTSMCTDAIVRSRKSLPHKMVLSLKRIPDL